MRSSQMLKDQLKDLETKRKQREISAEDFYKGLLKIFSELKESLIKETLSEAQVRKQIPFLLTFLKSQIKELENRGG